MALLLVGWLGAGRLAGWAPVPSPRLSQRAVTDGLLALVDDPTLDPTDGLCQRHRLPRRDRLVALKPRSRSVPKAAEGRNWMNWSVVGQFGHRSRAGVGASLAGSS